MNEILKRLNEIFPDGGDKFCVNCKHSNYYSPSLNCYAKSITCRDLVYGKNTVENVYNCAFMRDTNGHPECGASGKLYERQWWKFWATK